VGKSAKPYAPAPRLPGVERFIFLIQGELVGSYKVPYGNHALQEFKLRPGGDEYAFFPAGTGHEFECAKGEAVFLMYEQVYRPHPRAIKNKEELVSPQVVIGNVDAQAMLDPGAPEVFGLRKLLPLSEEYDFNIHIMDFEPGQGGCQFSHNHVILQYSR
jgi:(S)-ureidoglycine aminohydrolase